MFNEITKKIEFGGTTLELSTGKFARQADGSVMIKQGQSMVLCTSVSSKEAKEGVDFFPLTVNYLEKAYAAGKIPGGFLKKEGGGRSDREILVSRLIDRPIRPLFHQHFFNETHVVCTVHSYDSRYQTDILSVIGASAAIALSGIPYMDIVAASRVGLINGEFVLNPTAEQMQVSELDLVVAGTVDSVMMVESEASLLSEKQMLDAVKFGHDGFQPVIKLIKELAAVAGKSKWETTELYPVSLKNEIKELVQSDVLKAFSIKIKQERYAAIKEIKQKVIAQFTAEDKYNELQINLALEEVKSELLRHDTLSKKVRIDGRKPDEIRPIECEVGLFPSVHGSSLFTRGETQAVVFATLGSGQDEQIIESLEGEYKERFLLNYIFPPFSVGEAGSIRAPSRREVGHGKLAWRALARAIPSKEAFPYTIRLVSEITESNGSSSMATVCGASMAMMNAGIPMQDPIAGIAMGLIKEEKNFIVLSDIIADEDHLGDMDFKVAGSKDGVTALQMDIKVAGITFEIMEQALEQAKAGRLHILGKMGMAITEKGEISDNAPLIETFKVAKDKIREIIGPGGAVIREICESTGAKIDISDDGEVTVFAVGKEKVNAAVSRIKQIAIDPEIGLIYEGTVVKIIDAGAFINFHGNKDGFVHISEISEERVEAVDKFLSVGQKVRVKLVGYDRGKAKLTIKNVDKVAAAPTETKAGSEKKESSAAPAKNKDRDFNKKGGKKESSKKWNNDNPNSSNSDDIEIKEKKYFN